MSTAETPHWPQYTPEDWMTVQQLPKLLRESTEASKQQAAAILEMVKAIEMQVATSDRKVDAIERQVQEIRAGNEAFRQEALKRLDRADEDISSANRRIEAFSGNWKVLIALGAIFTFIGSAILGVIEFAAKWRELFPTSHK